MGFLVREIFFEFHKLIAIHENFTLKLFTLGINKTVLFKYFKVDKHMKDDCQAQVAHFGYGIWKLDSLFSIMKYEPLIIVYEVLMQGSGNM